MRIIAQSPEHTLSLGAAIGRALNPGDVVFLIGQLGAGKSVLARGIAGGLGVDQPMPSPTFTLMRPYRGRASVYHFDLYRLESDEEFEMAGLSDYIGGDGVAIIEWPDQIGLEWPDALVIQIDRGQTETQRELTIRWPDARAGALLAELSGREAAR